MDKRLIVSFLLVLFGFVCGCSRGVAWLDERDRSVPLMQRARDKENEGDVNSAVRLYAKALDDNPKLARAHLDIALLLHDYENDYVGAVYHYRRYLELRPQTEKREMIKNRIRVAGQLFAASAFRLTGNTAGRIARLVRENAKLKYEVKKLQAELEARNLKLETRNSERPPSPRSAGLRRGKRNSERGDGESEIRVPAKRDKSEPRPATAGSEFRVRRYCIKPGDTLSSIAAELYQDASRWEEIYEANRESLPDSNNLKVGQVLVIP